MVVLPFAVHSRKFGTKFPVNFQRTDFFESQIIHFKGLRLRASLRQDETAWQARNNNATILAELGSQRVQRRRDYVTKKRRGVGTCRTRCLDRLMP
jgi:hypothetical protein